MSNTSGKTITISDVAALAGIGKATASRALNGKGYTSPKTREAALNAARELGFQPNLHARRLVQGRSHNTIALVSNSDLGVLSRQGSFINYRLEEQDFEVQNHNNPRWVKRAEVKQVALLNKLRQQFPAAIICTSIAPQAVQELQLFIQAGGVVTVYGDKIDLECDQVPFDTSHRAYLATRHLLELGHREIGFCFHAPVQRDSTELAGFSRAMEEFGAPIQNDWLFGGGNYEEGGARLAEAFLNWPKKPTGMCIVNDVSASVFVTMLARNGVSVPDDVSVVGFDDSPIANYALVPLTCVNYPLEAIGRHVVELTQTRLKGYDGPPRTVDVQSELITRSSTAPYRPKGRSRTRKSSTSLADPRLSTGVFSTSR
jgi:DNA-binding LacI/PurR family transcriptional regulator